MSSVIDNTADILDVRDIIERVESLERLRQPGPIDLGDEEDNSTDQDDLFAELSMLESFMTELRNTGGGAVQWRGIWYPLILIHESHFEDYARELAEDIGAIDRDAAWPTGCIDWAQAADHLRIDYTSVDFGGETYLTR